MEYEIRFSKRVAVQLRKFESNVQKRLRARIRLLQHFPFRNTKPLTGLDCRSLRVGGYRVIIYIVGNLVRVLYIGKRENVYKKLRLLRLDVDEIGQG